MIFLFQAKDIRNKKTEYEGDKKNKFQMFVVHLCSRTLKLALPKKAMTALKNQSKSKGKKYHNQVSSISDSAK